MKHLILVIVAFFILIGCSQSPSVNSYKIGGEPCGDKVRWTTLCGVSGELRFKMRNTKITELHFTAKNVEKQALWQTDILTKYKMNNTTRTVTRDGIIYSQTIGDCVYSVSYTNYTDRALFSIVKLK